ncbi:MAG: DUF448 domain-containing protein [Pseudomonadota bacterium]
MVGKRSSAEQTCVVTGNVSAPFNLIRLVVDHNGVLFTDLGNKLGGKAAYVSSAKDILHRAISEGFLDRAFGLDATLASGISAAGFIDAIEDALEERVCNAAGLARRAGTLLVGYDDIAASCSRPSKRPALILASNDVSARSAEAAEKLGNAHNVPLLKDLTQNALSSAVGLNGVKYVAFKGGHLPPVSVGDAYRLGGLRPGKFVENSF